MMRISGESLIRFDFKATELRQFRASEPKRLGKKFKSNPIELLSDLLPLINQYAEIQFYLELKQDSVDHFGLESSLKAISDVMENVPSNCVFISFAEAAVLKAKQVGFNKTALVFRDWMRRNQLLQSAQADMGFINQKYIPESDSIKAIAPIFVYETCELGVARSLIDRGAQAVETFCIGKLLQR